MCDCSEIYSWRVPRKHKFCWFGCLEERFDCTVFLLSLRPAKASSSPYKLLLTTTTTLKKSEEKKKKKGERQKKLKNTKGWKERLIIELKGVLFNLLCVFELMFSERWKSTLFQIFFLSLVTKRTSGPIFHSFSPLEFIIVVQHIKNKNIYLS